MAVRLSGVFDPERREEAAAPAEREWEERYPALPPWRRVVRRFLCLTIVLDVSGDSALSDGLRTEEDGRLGVAGAIRLDRRSELIQALGVEGPSVEGGTGLILAAGRANAGRRDDPRLPARSLRRQREDVLSRGEARSPPTRPPGSAARSAPGTDTRARQRPRRVLYAGRVRPRFPYGAPAVRG